MSATLIREVRDDHDPRLTPPLKWTLTVLASFHWDKTPETGTKVRNRRVAEATGYSLRTVERHIAELTKMGKILVEEGPHPKRRGKVFVLSSVASDARQASPVSLGSVASVASKYQVPNQVEEQQVPTGIARAEREPQEDAVPDPRMEGRSVFDEEKPASKTKKKRQVAEKGSSAWVEHEWDTHLRVYAKVTDWDRMMFRGAMKHLRERGHTNEELAEAIRSWVISNANFIKSKREVDPTKLFVGAVNNGLLRETSTSVNKKVNTAFGAQSANEKLGW